MDDEEGDEEEVEDSENEKATTGEEPKVAQAFVRSFSLRAAAVGAHSRCTCPDRRWRKVKSWSMITQPTICTTR